MSAKIGKYRIDKRLPGGAQGEILFVRVAGVEHTLPSAMKLCKSDAPQSRRRFESEIRLLEENKHQNIVEVLDKHLGWDPDAWYVMPRAEGTLDDDQFSGTALKLLSLFRDACMGVRYLHSRGVLHRDLKPSNILIMGGELCRAVVADLGIAIEGGAQGDNTKTGEMIAPRGYRAPEVATFSDASVLSDIYSLGRVLERILTGQTPTDTIPIPISSQQLRLTPYAAEELNKIIARAAAWNPSDRFKSVNELLEAMPTLIVDVDQGASGKILLGEAEPPSEVADRSEAIDGEVIDDVSEITKGIAAGMEVGRYDPFELGHGAPVVWRPENHAYAFLHVAPLPLLPKMTQFDLMKHFEPQELPYLGGRDSYSPVFSAYGGAIFGVQGEDHGTGQKFTQRVTFLKDRGQAMVVDGRAIKVFDRDNQGRELRYIEILSLERQMANWLSSCEFFYARKFDSPSLEVTVGLVGTSETVIALPREYFEPRWSGQLFEETIGFQFRISDYFDGDAVKGGLLMAFFRHLWKLYGVERPAKLHSR